jgi:ribose transport system substrate-binding protein
MAPLTTSYLQRFGDDLNWILGINDLYFDFSVPALSAAGVPPSGPPQFVSAGDGSVSAYERVRAGQYQAATIPEPLNLHGWQCLDELNRAFAGEEPSGYVTPVHLVTNENIEFDGGPQNLFDPDNNYRDEYTRIWGVS